MGNYHTPPETTHRYMYIIVSDVNVTGQTLLHIEGRYKGAGCHGNHYRSCHLPHPQDCSFQNRFFEPKSQKTLPENFETPLEYYGLLCRNDVCTTIWLLQLVKQVQLLSSSAPPHEDTLTVQFLVGR